MENLDICDLFLNQKDKSKIVLELHVQEGLEIEVIQELYKSYNEGKDLCKGATVSKIFFGNNDIDDLAETAKTNTLLHVESLIKSLETTKNIINQKVVNSSIYKLS